MRTLKSALGVLLLTLLTLLASYQFPYSYFLDVGRDAARPWIHNFEDPGLVRERKELWSLGNPILFFPGVAQNRSYELVLRIAGHPTPDSTEVAVYADGELVGQFEAEARIARYTVPLRRPLTLRPDLRVELAVPTFNPSVDLPNSQDDRNLGVLVDWVELRPAGALFALALPPLLPGVGWLVVGLLWFALIRQTPFARRTSSQAVAVLAGEATIALVLITVRTWAVPLVWYVCLALAAAALIAARLPGWWEGARSGQPSSLKLLHTLGISNARLRGAIELAVVVVIAVHFFVSVLWILRTHSLPDFIAYYSGIGVWLEGGDYYDGDLSKQFSATHTPLGDQVTSFIYPPSAVLLLAPAALPPVDQAKELWLVLDFLFLTGAGLLAWLAVRKATPFPASPVWLAPMLSFSRPLRNSIGEGQVGPLLLFLFALGLWAWTERRLWIAGVSLAVATALKLFPAFLLAYLLWKRAWRAVVAAIAAGLLTFVLSLFAGGLPAWWTFITEVFLPWSRGMANTDNQSPNGFIRRMLTSSDLFRDYDPSHNPDLLAVRVLTLAITLGLLILTAYWMRRGESDTSLSQRHVEYSAALVLMLLSTPLVWEHYLMWLILPFYVILNTLANRPMPAFSQIGLLLVVGVAWVLLQFGPDLYSNPDWPVPLFSLGLYATVLLYGGLIYLLARPEPAPR